MQITLKKVLLCGIMILSAVFFFLIVCLPVSRTVTITDPILGSVISTTTYKASLLDVLAEKKDAIAMVESQIDISKYVNTTSIVSAVASGDVSASGWEAYQQAIKALVTVYKVFAVMGIVLFVLNVCAVIGAFFIPSMKGARGLILPFFIVGMIFYVVVAVFATMLVASTSMIEAANSSYVKVSVSAGAPWIMWVLGLLAFIGALVSSGAVRDVVFVGKKK